MRFSPSTMGWYPETINYPNLPKDVIIVPDSLYEELVGKQITTDQNGIPKLWEPAEPTVDDMVNGLVAALQAEMDRVAREYRYDDLKTAITYRGDPNPRFSAEAEGFFQWRSAVWTFAYAYMDEVLAGEKDLPTVQEAIGMLPELNIEYP